MLKQVYKIDADGFLIEILVKNFDEQENCTEELAENIITVDPPQGLYRAKWTGTEWIEDKTTEEFEAEELLNSLIPTQEEIQNAELEIKILTLLQEMMI